MCGDDFVSLPGSLQVCLLAVCSASPLVRTCRPLRAHGLVAPPQRLPQTPLDKDDMVYMEAYDRLLESWLTLVQDDKHFHKGFFTQHAVQVFNSYIQCHLAAPDGTRNLTANGVASREEEEISELQEDDRDQFSDQLASVGMLGRIAAEHCVPLLTSRSRAKGASLVLPMPRPEQRLPAAAVLRCQHHVARGALCRKDGSPQMGKDIVWFLKRWAKTYLLVDEKLYDQISVPFSTAFGADTEGSQWIVGYLLQKVLSNLSVCSSEQDLASDTVQLLVTLVERRERANLVIQCENWWNLAKQFASRSPPLNFLSSPVQRTLMKALVLGGFAHMDTETKQQYWTEDTDAVDWAEGRHVSPAESLSWRLLLPGEAVVCPLVLNEEVQVLQPLQQRFLRVINQENFQQLCQQEEVKQEITATLEALCGIAEATQVDNVAILFNFLMDFLTNCIGLMEVYRNTPETVNLIIEVFVEVAHKQICYLGERIDVTAEEEQYQDLLLIMELLTNLLSKEFIDFSDTVQNNPTHLHPETLSGPGPRPVSVVRLLGDAACPLVGRDLPTFLRGEGSSVAPSASGCATAGFPFADEVFRGQEVGPTAGRPVSAADVVLYGVNLILPLMSQDLLKVTEDTNVLLELRALGSEGLSDRNTPDLMEGCQYLLVCYVRVKIERLCYCCVPFTLVCAAPSTDLA
ncbi:hypothetical protein CB1_000273049 [Camelus ferus]|nr:hypothetical protein CB1_000273049 [Camelus ferus]